jgi:hypothetical protein
LCLFVVLAFACSKESNQKPDEKKDSPATTAAPTEPDKKVTDKTAADVMAQSIEQAKAKAAAGTTPPPPPPKPVDPLPPETPPTTTPPPADPIAAPPAAAEFKVGDKVMAKWTNGSWYPGKIVAINDGKYDVNYDDGDKSRGLPAAKVKKRSSSSSSSGGKSSTSTSDAPCPGPGITRRCNGRCVNIQEDNNHCGGCNNRCPDGKHCDGHLFCRDADGNL